MYTLTRFFIFFFLLSFSIKSQDLSGIILDETNKKPIPFSSVYLKSGKGVVSNEEGRFRLNINSANDNDSLYISCMGYQTLRLLNSNVSDSVFYLSPKTIELKSIILSSKDLNVDEIIKEIQKNIKDKYELGITKKNIFLRETGSQKFKKLEIKIKKTSIPEFNQYFWDSTLIKIPKYNKWYFELLGNLTGNYSNEKQKLELVRALELEDKEKTAIFENIEKLFDTILNKNIKTNSFFKVRSGIIGGKVQADEMVKIPNDTISEEQKIQNKKDDFLKWRKRVLSNLITGLFDEDKFDLSIIKKAYKYKFSESNFTYLGETPVYIFDFIPNGNADYKGKIYIDADKLALIRLEYKNIHPIRDFSIFGVSFKEDLREVVIQFKKLNSGKYGLEFLDFNSSFEGGFERPLVITEKNKIVKGRNKQNQLKMDLNVVNRNTQRFQLVVFETELLENNIFDKIDEKGSLLPVNKTSYDPEFWEGFTIIEPNKVIQEFSIDN